MKSFKEFLTEMQVDIKDLISKDDLAKLEKHYGGNAGTKNIYNDIQDYKAAHAQFIKDPDAVADRVKRNMVQTSKALKKIGKEDGII